MRDYKTLSKDTFDKQAENYDQDIHGQHARRLYPFMLQEIIKAYGDHVLDLGCGTGALMEQVYQECPHRTLYGIDLSENMLKIAENRMKDKAILKLGDASMLPFDDLMFDIVYCNDSFHHYPDPESVIGEVYRVLKFGGTFIIGDCYQGFPMRLIMNMFMKYSKDGDVKIYAKKEIEKMLGFYFHDIKWKKVNDRSMIVTGVK